jgi:sec-independent protein translocase protein TatC
MKTSEEDLTFIEHLIELRRRTITSLIAVLLAAVLCFAFYDAIFRFFFAPFEVLKGPDFTGNTLFVNSLFEGFLTKLKISLLTGLILSTPVHIYNGIKFIFPGLKPKERKIVKITLLCSFLLIAGSLYYGYSKIIPLSIRFLTSSGFIPSDVGILLNYGQNIFYILQFLLIALIIFQLPLVVELCMILNLVRRRTMLRIAKYFIFGVFVLSAILTPPDLISQVSIALPLIVLYFLTILIARIFRFGEEGV